MHLARRTGQPVRYLASSAADKEAIAREIAFADGIERGLICLLTAVEACQSFEVVRDRTTKRPVEMFATRSAMDTPNSQIPDGTS